MAATALIQFTQGVVVGIPGQALVGVTGTLVNVANQDNTGVNSWQIDLVYTPPGSAVPVSTPLAFSDNGTTPAASFTPDILGSYRVVLTVWDAINRVGSHDGDIRNFIVPGIKHGLVIPPYQEDPQPHPTLASGFPSAKPNETNIGGSEKGWVGNGADGLLADFIRRVDASNFDLLPDPSGVGAVPINAPAGVTLNLPYFSATDGTSVWVTNANAAAVSAPTLARIDPTVPAIISQTTVGTSTDFLLGITWDGGANMWATAMFSGGTSPQLIKFPIANPAAFTVYPLTGVTFAYDVAYDALNNLLWVADSALPNVVAYNPASPGTPVQTVPTSGPATRIFYDPVGANYGDTNPRIWSVGAGSADRVDLVGFTVDATFTMGSLAWGSVGGGYVWFTDPGAQNIYRVIPSTAALDVTLPFGVTYSPQSVLYNATLNRLFVLALDGTSTVFLLRTDIAGNIEASGSTALTSLVPLIATPTILPGPGGFDNFWFPDGSNDKIWAFSTLSAGSLTATEVTGPLSIQWLTPAGDLANNFTNTKVVGLQTYPVSAAVPSNGQILGFFSGSWAPFSVFGDLHINTFTAQTVLDKIHGSPINASISASPRIGSYLSYTSIAGWSNTSFEFGIVQSVTSASDNWDGDADVVDLNFVGNQAVAFNFGVGDQGKLVWFKSSGGNATDQITVQDPVGTILLSTTRDKINGYSFFKYDASGAGLWALVINPNSAIRTNPIVSITPAAITAQADDYNPAGPGSGVPYSEILWRLSSTGAFDITGIVAASGTRYTLVNIGVNTLTLKHLNGASSAANQIIGLGGVDKSLPANGAAVLIYDDTSAKWRVIS